MINSRVNPLSYLTLVCLFSFSTTVRGDWYHPELESTVMPSAGEQAMAELFGIQPLPGASGQNVTDELESVARSGLNALRINELEIAIAATAPIPQDLSQYPASYGLTAMAERAVDARQRKSMASNSSMPMLGNRPRNLQRAGFINVSHKTLAVEPATNFPTITNSESLLANGRRNSAEIAQAANEADQKGLLNSLFSQLSIGNWIFVVMTCLGLICLKRIH